MRDAPTRFPNRLDEHGLSEDENAKIIADITSLERDLSSALASYQTWSSALEASHTTREKEDAFLDEAVFLRPVKHLDVRGILKRDYLKSRLAYLLRLKSEVDQWLKHSSDGQIKGS